MRGHAVSKKREILENALYSVDEVAEILGTRRRMTVYQIPESELVPTWVGPRRGRKMYRGRDILRYMDQGRRVA
jgi:hypothetical protein